MWVRVHESSWTIVNFSGFWSVTAKREKMSSVCVDVAREFDDSDSDLYSGGLL